MRVFVFFISLFSYFSLFFLGALPLSLSAEEQINELLEKSYKEYKNDNLPKAEELTKRLISLAPNLPQPYNNLAVIYTKLGKYKEAELFYNEALKTSTIYQAISTNINDLITHRDLVNYNNIIGLPTDSVKEPIFLSNISSSPSSESVLAGTNSPETTIKNWINAWSSGDAAAYIELYAKNFTPVGISKQNWLDTRGSKIHPSLKIDISYSNLKIIQLTPSTALARFRQKYRSKSYQDTTEKELILLLENNTWKILKETAYIPD